MAEENGVIRIAIPSRRSWLVLAAMGLWLCGWAVGEIAVPYIMLRGGPGRPLAPPDVAFLAVWLTLWTLAGAAAVYSWVWNAVGREIVELDGRALTLRREPIGFPPRKEYDLSSVRNLRVAPFAGSAMPYSASFAILRGGPLAFDYGAQTIRFGAGIDEAEARMIIDSIRTRFPELGA